MLRDMLTMLDFRFMVLGLIICDLDLSNEFPNRWKMKDDISIFQLYLFKLENISIKENGSSLSFLIYFVHVISQYYK